MPEGLLYLWHHLTRSHLTLSVTFGDSSPRGGAKACREAGCYEYTALITPTSQAPSDEGAGAKRLRERKLLVCAHFHPQLSR